MKISIKILTAVVLMILFAPKGSAQIGIMQNYVFSQDSTAGFDEQAASAAALGNNCYGNEYKVFMYRAKRAYIKAKYDLRDAVLPQTLFQNPVGKGAPSAVGGACNNEDFELGTIQGWVPQSGSNQNSCQEPLFNGASLYTVFTSPVTDARLPYQVTSYFDAGNPVTPSGNGFILLNEDNAGGDAVRITKTFIPTPTSAVFQYAYLTLVQDGCHGCCDQAGFNIKVSISLTSTPSTWTVLSCPQISIAVPAGTNCGSSGCQFTPPLGGPVFKPALGTGAGWSYCDWTASAIDLTPYMNTHNVKLEVTVVDCNAGGHGGYSYFDAKCSPMTIIGNDNEFPAGTTSITLPSCGAIGSTICATPGLGPYSWFGPNVPPSYNTPSFTNTCFTATLSATYTLVMNPPGSCVPLTKIITTTNTPAPSLLASVTQAVCGQTLALVTVTPAGSAATNPTIIYSPPPYATNSTSTSSQFTVPPNPGDPKDTVIVTAYDPLGCKVSQTLTIDPVAPTPTFSLMNATNVNSLTCNTPSLVFDAISNYTYGPKSYFWAAPSATFATNPVTITIPGSYTVTLKDAVTGCFADSVFVVPMNTVAPTTVVSPTMQIISCSLSSIQTVTGTASPSINVSQFIYSKFSSGVSYSVNASIILYTPPAPGEYTHCAVNDVNGCKTCKNFTVTSNQGFPVFEVISADNFTLGCNTKSVASIQIINASATGTDQVPNGGPVTYSLICPSCSTVTPPGLLTTTSNYTVNVPGSYTIVTRDNNSSCETRLPLSILLNNAGPKLAVTYSTNIIDCNTPSVALKGSSGTPNVNYTWLFPGTPPSLANAQIVATINPAAPNTSLVANYTLEIEDNSSTCVSTSVVPIYQSLYQPTAIFSGTGALSCITTSIMLTNQSKSNIPKGSIFPTSLPAVGYLWQGPTPQNPLSNSTSYVAKTPGVYTLTAKDMNNGCTGTVTGTIADNIKYPGVNEQPPPPSILDCGAKQATLMPVLTTFSTGATFTWSAPGLAITSDKNKIPLLTDTVGEYPLAVRNPSSGCITRVIMEVINGELTVNFTPDKTTGFAPLTVNFQNNSTSTTGSSSITSVWSFDNGRTTTVSGVAPVNTTFNAPGNYSVTLFASKGQCLKSITKEITVDIPSELDVPNVFTPNNDGINDMYFLKATNLTDITMQIFDRWGHLVYELTTNGNVGWDGKNQAGIEQAEGTYFFVLKATGKDGMSYEKNGTISLIR